MRRCLARHLSRKCAVYGTAVVGLALRTRRETSEMLSSIITACPCFRHATSVAVVPPCRPDGRTAPSLFATRTCSSAMRRAPTPSAGARSKLRGARPSKGAKKSKSGGTQCNWERRAGGQPTASATSLAAQRWRTTKAPQHRHGTGSSGSSSSSISRGGDRSSSSVVSPPLLPQSIRKRTIPGKKRQARYPTRPTSTVPIQEHPRWPSRRVRLTDRRHRRERPGGPPVSSKHQQD